MSRWMIALVVGVLSAAASPALAAALGADNARHLLSRATFAATPADIDSFAALTREQAVERLLSGTHPSRVTAPPPWVVEPVTPLQQVRAMSTEERQAWQRTNVARGLDLRGWWFDLEDVNGEFIIPSDKD